MADRYFVLGNGVMAHSGLSANGREIAQAVCDTLNRVTHPAPVLYLRKDGSRVEDERREDLGRYVSDEERVLVSKDKAVWSPPIDNESRADVAKVIASALSAAYDRRNRKPIEERSGNERRYKSSRSGRRDWDTYMSGPDHEARCVQCRSSISKRIGRREKDRRVTTSTAAGRKGGE